jgi:hypothetical protein
VGGVDIGGDAVLDADREAVCVSLWTAVQESADEVDAGDVFRPAMVDRDDVGCLVVGVGGVKGRR